MYKRQDLYYRFTQKEYDSVQLLESVSDANGVAIRIGYNGKGHLKEITDSAGRRLAVECDEMCIRDRYLFVQ